MANQDDCSVPVDSELFDPGQVSLEDPYGGAGTYRCAEFGLLCDGVKPPHALAAGSGELALNACVPAEAAGLLTPIADLTSDLMGLKKDSYEVSVSLIAGPSDPVVVAPQPVALDTGVTEDQPRLQPSCAGSSDESAAPSVRLKAWADGFTQNGVFLPACVDADMLATAVTAQLGRLPIGMGAECIDGVLLPTETGLPNCQVTQTSVQEGGSELQWELPRCDADRTVLPCWKVDPNAWQCLGAGAGFAVCRNASCTGAPDLTPWGSVAVHCQVAC